MEYGVFVSETRELPADPRSICVDEWRELLPPAPLRAIYFGSEFCQDLLPTLAAVERLCLWAAQAGVEAVLLTPMVTPRGLLLVDHLLRELAGHGFAPSLVVNDWGVLNLLRRSYPGLRRRAGRLMNRGLRDPRLPERTAPGDDQGGQQVGRMRAMLLQSGVEAVETDADLEGNHLGEKVDGLQRVLHFPYVFAASGRNCLVKADGAASAEDCFTKGLSLPCPGLCRGRWHEVTREDTDRQLWRSGNTIFYQVSQEAAAAHLARADRVVLYERPTA